MEWGILGIGFVILLCFVFDFTNGFHDAANSIATIIATGVLTGRQAVVFAAFFNFIAFFWFKFSVASTIATGLVQTSIIDTAFVFSVVTAAIVWNLLTWFFGLPSSSSHALMGGFVGAALVKGGVAAIKMMMMIKVMLIIVFAPLLGIFAAFCVVKVVEQMTKNKNEHFKNKLFKYLQLLSSALLSMAHGSNDAQKTMGLIAILLFSTSVLEGPFYVPWWVAATCYFVIALGTLSGGWRIVRTLSQHITLLDPLRGCCAETGATAVILAATHFGFPVSTTYTITGAIAGVGLSNGWRATHWHMVLRIFIAWLLTIPATALAAALLLLVY
jgi:PiT family inorganic phosphate transporter